MSWSYAFTTRELKRLMEAPARRKLKVPSGEIDKQGLQVNPAWMRRLVEANGQKFSGLSIAHLNMRGGIGKTTASVNLAARAAQYGFRTCLVDLDPQASATFTLGEGLHPGYLVMADIWQNLKKLDEALHQIDPGLYLLPSSLDNTILDEQWQNVHIQRNFITNLMDELRSRHFDLIIFDAPPALSSIVISIIAAVETISVPVWSDPFSLRGVELIIQEAAEITRVFGHDMPDIRILYAQYDRRLSITADQVKQIESRWPEKLYKTRIRTSTEFSKAITRRQTIFKYSLKSQATIDYDSYVREVLRIPLPSPF
jgi:chromosome partitioning protein